MRLYLFLSAALVTACIAPTDSTVDGSNPSGYVPNDDQDPGGDPEDRGVEINEDVVVLDDHECLETVIVPEDQRVLTFVFTCDPTGVIEPGDIVVGTVDGGYLRRVESIELDGWTVVAYTTEASIAEAVDYGGLEIRYEGTTEERALLDFGNTVFFAEEVLGSDVLFKLNRGAIDLSPVINIDGHWGEGAVQRFDLEASFGIYADIEAFMSSSNGLRYGKDFDLWGTAWPFATAIGPLPVVGEVTVKVKVGFRLDAPGQVSSTAGATGRSTWSTTRTYRAGTGWTEDNNDEVSWEVRPPSLDVSADTSGRAYFRVEVGVSFYKVAGPTLTNDAYAKFTASPDCEGIDYDVNAGLTSRASIKMNILDKFKPTKTFATVDFTADVMDGTIAYPVGFPIPCAQPSISCGEAVSGDTSTMLSQLDAYDCNVGNYSAPEAIYEWTADRSGSVTFSLVDPVPTELDHDVIILNGAMDLVTGRCSEWGPNSVEFEAEQGETYYLVVDGFDSDAGPFDAELTCD